MLYGLAAITMDCRRAHKDSAKGVSACYTSPMTKKYEINDEGRIKALRDGPWGPAGTVGGFVEHPGNLSQFGEAWVYDRARVEDSAHMYGNAQVRGYARVQGNARVGGDANVGGHARVQGNARVHNHVTVAAFTRVGGDAQVHGNAVVGFNAQVSGKARVGEAARLINNAQVSGNARLIGNARVGGDANVEGNAQVSVFFKQWGGKIKKRTGRILDGRTWDEMPKLKTA